MFTMVLMCILFICGNDKLKKRKLTFGGIVKAYGGWRYDEIVRGAKRTAAKCSLLGPPWVATDKFSELTLYTILEHEWGRLPRTRMGRIRGEDR